jgi:hypothetical protein
MDLSTLLQILAYASAIGGACAVGHYRLKNVERIAKKAHQRLDLLDNGRWVQTGVMAASSSKEGGDG